MAKKKTTKKPAQKPKPEKPDKAKAKAEQSKKIAQAVWKATEAHKSTIGKLAGLVDTYDEYDTKAENLKEQIGGLKGMLAEDKAEIRRLAHLVNSPQHPTIEKDMKSLAGLERDCERREVKLAGLSEERSGAKEAMKCAMADIRKIVKEGPGLFEEKPQKTEEPEVKPAPRTASEVGAAAQKNATPPHSTSPESPAVEHPPLDRVDKSTGEVLRKPLALARA